MSGYGFSSMVRKFAYKGKACSELLQPLRLLQLRCLQVLLLDNIKIVKRHTCVLSCLSKVSGKAECITVANQAARMSIKYSALKNIYLSSLTLASSEPDAVKWNTNSRLWSRLSQLRCWQRTRMIINNKGLIIHPELCPIWNLCFHLTCERKWKCFFAMYFVFWCPYTLISGLSCLQSWSEQRGRSVSEAVADVTLWNNTTAPWFWQHCACHRVSEADMKQCYFLFWSTFHAISPAWPVCHISHHVGECKFSFSHSVWADCNALCSSLIDYGSLLNMQLV